MCLILFAHRVHPDYPLIVAANRDEFYKRPTRSLHWWDSEHQLLAGKDLEAGGTWMGVHRDGRFAALTNYRDLQNIKEDAPTRGEIPLNVLNAEIGTERSMQKLRDKADQYNGFSVLAGDLKKMEMWHLSNYEDGINHIKPGIHGLSNALLDTPWPKVVRGKQELREMIDRNEVSVQNLLRLLNDRSLAEDDELPDTGVEFELEKALSAMCIRTEEYGTCSSAVVLVDQRGEVTFAERSYPVGRREGKFTKMVFGLNG